MKLKILIIITFIGILWLCMYVGDEPFWKTFLFYLFLFPFVVWLYEATRGWEDESSIEILARLLSSKKSKDSKDGKGVEAEKEAQKEAQEEVREETIVLETLESDPEGVEVTIVQGDAEGNSEDSPDDEDTVVKEYCVRIKVKVVSKRPKRPKDESLPTDSRLS